MTDEIKIDGTTVAEKDSNGNLILKNLDDATLTALSTDDIDIASRPILVSSNGWDTFDGADADARLDSALSSASDGDTIFLENADYSANRTVSKRIRFIGTAPLTLGGTEISGTWTLSSRITIEHCGLQTAFDFNSARITIDNCRFNTDMTTDQNQTRLFGNEGVGYNFTFASGTSGGIANSNTGFGNITDNGTNTIGTNT